MKILHAATKTGHSQTNKYNIKKNQYILDWKKGIAESVTEVSCGGGLVTKWCLTLATPWTVA